jgi:ABC-type sugar transport system ATPase subunit
MDPVENSTESGSGKRTILEMRNVSKTYGGSRALHSVSLKIREAEIHSLTGENGAGKSTLMKILAGAVIPDPGSEIWAFGRQVTIRTPQDAAALGISIIHQELSLSGNQQKALLARLLELKPRVLFLDEPTRGIDIGAKSDIYRLVDAMAKESIAVAVISSELPELVGICDRVLVMREGKIAGEVGNAPGMTPLTQENIIAFARIINRRMPSLRSFWAVPALSVAPDRFWVL